MAGQDAIQAKTVDELTRAAQTEVRQWAPRSHEHFEHASRVIPGGTFRIRFFWPNPIFIDKASGAYLYDIDGHRLIDCNLGFGPLILGHNPPAVVQAISDQLGSGAMFPNTREAELAECIVPSVPNAAWVVFFNSGTEATLAATRVARAATGRKKIAKFEGGWHGWHDFLLWNTRAASGPPALADPVPMSAGIPDELGELVVPLPYNDRAAFERIRREAAEIAAVIVEPVQGAAGVIPAESDFLHELTEFCRQYGILVIADEVITGFRLGAGGGAEHYGIKPDLTTLGKVIGGGLPVGGLCGSEALRDTMINGAGNMRVVLGGTFSANPITMAAGAAQLRVLLDDPRHYEQLNSLGDRLREGLTEVSGEYGHHMQITGVGGMWGTHFAASPPRSVRDLGQRSDFKGQLLHHYLIREGVAMSAPVHLSFLSSAHTADDVDEVVEAHRTALGRMIKEGALA